MEDIDYLSKVFYPPINVQKSIAKLTDIFMLDKTCLWWNMSLSYFFSLQNYGFSSKV